MTGDKAVIKFYNKRGLAINKSDLIQFTSDSNEVTNHQKIEQYLKERVADNVTICAFKSKIVFGTVCKRFKIEIEDSECVKFDGENRKQRKFRMFTLYLEDYLFIYNRSIYICDKNFCCKSITYSSNYFKL